MASVEDQRLFERFAARFGAKITDSREDFGSKLYLRDLSAGGAQFMSKEKFFTNDSLTVDISVPGQYALTVKGTVVWVAKQTEDRWDFGVKFHKPDLLKISRLYEVVDNSTIQ